MQHIVMCLAQLMAIFSLMVVMLIVNLFCLGVMTYQAWQDRATKITVVETIKLSISGFFSFIADTLGIGSFACNISFAKLFKTFPDEQLPAVNNGAQVLPGLLEAIFFIKIIDVDTNMLLTLIAGACIGGVLGGTFMCHLDKQAVRITMMVAFSILIALLLSHQLGLVPLGGNIAVLGGAKLFLGFLGMIVCGALTSVGIGLFVMVQAVLFLLGVSPLIAFPIMTAAGALQQPLTTLIFLKNKKVPLRKTWILSLSGCVGVLLTIPIFTRLEVHWLHTLLLGLLFINLFAISRNFFKQRSALRQSTSAALNTV